MRIAAAVAIDGDGIVPLSEGPALIVLDTATMVEERYGNPGYPLETGKRKAATEFLHRRGVDLVCAVPQTFCPTSHQLAQSFGMRFLPLPPGATWSQVVQEQLWSGDATDAIEKAYLYIPKPAKQT